MLITDQVAIAPCTDPIQVKAIGYESDALKNDATQVSHN